MADAVTMPLMVWMEVDVKNKELPIRIADTAAELARVCGVSEHTVRSSATRAKYGRSRRRFVHVWIGDDV